MTDKQVLPPAPQPAPGPELHPEPVVLMVSGDSVAEIVLEPDPFGDPDRFHVRVIDTENAK